MEYKNRGGKARPGDCAASKRKNRRCSQPAPHCVHLCSLNYMCDDPWCFFLNIHFFHMVYYIHPPRPANCTLFCLEVLFLFRSLRTDPMTLLCKRRIEDFHRDTTVKFVSFTGAFTGKHIVKSVKEACKTIHSTPKETCQHATQFDRPCKTACFWWVKETPKDAQECHLGLCKFVGYFHVFPSSYLPRRKGPAVPKRDQQKMHRKSLYIFQTHGDERGPHVINFPHLLLL